MKGITKATRMNVALQVIQHMNAGLTVVEACRAVGMPRSSFYYIMENNPEAFAEVQAIIDNNNREQIGLMLMSQTEMLQKIIEDGLSDSTKPKDRLAIYLKLNELLGGLKDTLRDDNPLNKDMHELLMRGPVVVQAESRITTRETTITYETQ
jgi:hypothetical protein